MADRHYLPRRRALFESRREREFYRYYEPIRSLSESGPPLCDLFDDAAVKRHVPFSSPDPALTAFCQLAALRLGTRRAMLFFFDSNYAYVLAEATPTLSLKDDSIHEVDDKLWLGHSVIPRGFSICEETVCSLPPSDEATPDSGHHLVHIINDLEKDTQFCDRPYVTDGPKARFYAGVPITTPKGINIGAFCLLDDKTRDGLDEKGISFLKDMASTVMKHLDMARAKAEHIRGTRMVTGLGAFIEGASSLRTWQEQNERRSDRQEGGRPGANVILPPMAVRPKPSPPQVSVTECTTFIPNLSADQTGCGPGQAVQIDSNNPSGDSVPQLGEGEEIKSAGTPADESQASEGVGIAGSRSAKTIRQADDGIQAQLVAGNVRSTFQRAADLIREAVDVEGTFFLDAAIGTYGGLVEAHDGSDQSSDALVSGTDHAGDESEEQKVRYGEGVPDRLCTVLASSHTRKDHYHTTREMQAVTEKGNITERFLRSLLRRYGHGKIWNFNDAGDASSDDDSSESGSLKDSLKRSSGGGSSSTSTKTRKDHRRRKRIEDGREIQRLFPGVRSLALVGMWDQTRGRWFSACAVYTYSPLRLFSADSEISYIAAFCDVIIAEVHRLEAQNSDRAKSDFISSISHELRSPLHGILGSVECLQDQAFDSFSTGLISQIEICGRTLLDIVDHLLDFSKVSHLARTKPLLSDAQGKRRISSTTAQVSQLGGLMSLDTEVALDEVTEEVVETAVYSFCCARDKSFILNRKVSVILDVDRATETSWRCRVPLGGWKRICINLLSNALKYTDAGFIHCSLKAAPVPGKKKRFNVTFEVKDSGRGMNREFLENHLFKAFSQEDTLTEGTGLGMSLVAKIVKAMNGKIEVQSEKGVGTTVKVAAPFERSIRGNEETANGSQPGLHHPFEDSIVGILGFDEMPTATGEPQSRHQIARKLTLQSVRTHCQHLGLDVKRLRLGAEHDVHVLMLAEEDLGRYRRDLLSDSQSGFEVQRPLIILCSSAISARKLRGDGIRQDQSVEIEYISQPCTTSKLSSALRRCLGSQAETRLDKQEQADGGAQSSIADAPELTAPIHHRRGAIPVLDEILDEVLLSPRSEVSDSFPRTDERPGHEASTRSRSTVKEEPTANRSKSTGARPHSPFPLVDPLLEKSSKKMLRNSGADPASADGLSLLLVDDNQINLQLLINYARKQGHRKCTATDGAEAVRLYKEAALVSMGAEAQDGRPSQKPEIILLDINMPVMNGFEASREIRAFEQQHGIEPAHIIALTGLGSASAQQEAFSSGVDLFLTKPVRLKELTKLLNGIREADKDCQSRVKKDKTQHGKINERDVCYQLD